MLQAYKDYKPTAHDIAGLNLPDRQDWLVCPLILTRDARLIDESNWHTAIKLLSDIDPNERDHMIASFNHWACGWFEILLVRPNSEAHKVATKIDHNLESYPILDEFDLSDREFKYACETWEHMSIRDRIELLAENDCTIFAARRDELPSESVDPYGHLYQALTADA